MTKEQHLERRILAFPSDGDMTDEAIKRNVYAVMDTYARQEAIAFEQFAREIAKWHPDVNRYCLKDFDGAYYTREELYDLYLTYKNKTDGQ